ncbi:MAG: type II secretion system protein N [Candidatus Rokuibacteriota bacterium]
MGRRLLLIVDVLLIAAAGWLGVTLHDAWSAAPKRPSVRAGTSTVPTPTADAPPAPETSIVAPEPAPVATFAVIAERNLFSPSRTEAPPEPPRPVTATPTAPPAPPAPKPRLYGVVLGSRNGGLAYLEDPRTRKVFGYTVGDSVAESRLERIEADRVVMRRAGEVFEVLLRDPTKPRPAPAPQAPVTRTPQIPFPTGLPATEGSTVTPAPGGRSPVAQPGASPRRPAIRTPAPAPSPAPQTEVQPAPPSDDEE